MNNHYNLHRILLKRFGAVFIIHQICSKALIIFNRSYFSNMTTFNYSTIGSTAAVLNTPHCALKTNKEKDVLVDSTYYFAYERKTIFNTRIIENELTIQ
jgi:hypothetical protein